MWNRLSVRVALAGAVLLAVLIGACQPSRDRSATTTAGTADSARMADTSASAGMAARDMAPGKSAMGTLSDPNIVALLDEANEADSAAGAFALRKATDPDVKAFAAMMMTDHHALRVQGQQLAKRLKVTPEPPANDPMQAAGKAEMDSLRAVPKGAQFDRTYIDQEVGVHRAVLDLAGKAHDATQNPELKNLIEKAKPIIQRHLDRAEALQQKLGKRTA